MADLCERIVECLEAIGKACSPTELRARSSLSAGLDLIALSMSEMATDGRLIVVADGRYSTPAQMSRRAPTDAAVRVIGTRRKIMDIIEGASMSCGDIAATLNKSVGAVSYHLTNLRKEGLIETDGGRWSIVGRSTPEGKASAAAVARQIPQLRPRQPLAALPDDQDRVSTLLGKIVHKAPPRIAPVGDLELKIAVLGKLRSLYDPDVAIVLACIQSDIKRLSEIATHD